MKEISYLLLGVLAGWLIEWIIDWFYWRRRNRTWQNENAALRAQISQLGEKLSESKGPKESPVIRDDFTLISGIGPVISKTLQDAGITTFRALAAISPDQLRLILGDLVERLADEDDLLRQAKHFAREKKLAQKARKAKKKKKDKKPKKMRKQVSRFVFSMDLIIR